MMKRKRLVWKQCLVSFLLVVMTFTSITTDCIVSSVSAQTIEKVVNTRTTKLLLYTYGQGTRDGTWSEVVEGVSTYTENNAVEEGWTWQYNTIDKKYTLVLENVNIKVAEDTGIVFASDTQEDTSTQQVTNTVQVIVKGNNTVSGGGEQDVDASVSGIFFPANTEKDIFVDVSITGDGTLNAISTPTPPITHNYGKSINVDKGNLTIQDATIIARGSMFASKNIKIINSNLKVESINNNATMMGRESVEIEKSTVVLNVNNQLEGSSDDNTRGLSSKNITIKESDVTAGGGAYGIYASENMNIQKSTIDANGHTWMGLKTNSMIIEDSSIEAVGKLYGITADNGVVDISNSSLHAKAEVRAAVYASQLNNTSPAIILGGRMKLKEEAKVGVTEIPNGGFTGTSFILKTEDYVIPKFANTLKEVTIELMADYSKVEEAIKKIPADLSFYTKESVDVLTSAKNAVVLDKNISEQNIVDGYATAIENAIKALMYKPADYTKVEEAIKKIPADLSQFIKETVDALMNAKNSVVNGKNISEQNIVNGYATAIENAIKALMYKPADYTKVDDAIKNIPADLSLYTKESVDAVNNAKNAVVKDKNINEQSIVDGYATAIENAIKALMYKPADYTKVDDAIKKIPADLSLYTKESVDAVNNAKNAVVKDKNISEQSIVDGYATAIENAIKALMYKPADYTKVDDAIKKIPADLSLYTKESVDAVNNAKNAVVKDKNISEQSIVDGYATAIENAIKALTYKPADYTKVDDAIKKIPADLSFYTKETVDALTSAQNAVVKDKNILEQNTVDGYATAIENAIKALTYKAADYGKVEEAIKKIPADLSLFIKESVDALMNAKNAVVKDKNISEQHIVDGYATAIENAIKALIYKAADYTKVEEAIKKIPADVSLYTKESVDAVNNAKNAVVKDKNISEQSIVDGYATAIENAIKALTYKAADYRKVEEALNKIPADLTLYTKDTVDALTSAQNAVVNGKNILEQNTVDGYATAIENAIKALTYKAADYGKVEEAIKKIPADLSLYTKESVDALTNAQNAVVKDKNISEQHIVDGYAIAIEDAIKALTYKAADYRKVEEALNKLPADLTLYTKESVDALTNAQNAVVKDKNINEQSIVDGYATAIENAIQALTYKVADYSKVEEALNKIPADLTLYTKDTVDALTSAKNAVVYGKNILEQNTVNAYAVAIENAIKALTYKAADYSKVEEAIKKIPADLSFYTKESVDAVNNAKQAVVYDKNINEQSIVDGYATAIENAIRSLKIKPIRLPQIVEGNTQTIRQGELAIFKSDAQMSDFEKVLIDGIEIPARNYTVQEGSTIIILNSDFTKTLSTGKHTIIIVSKTGNAIADFNITKSESTETNTPQTGDNSQDASWLVLVCMMSGLSMLFLKKKHAER